MQGADQEQSELIQETGTRLNPNNRLEQINHVCSKIYLRYPFPYRPINFVLQSCRCFFFFFKGNFASKLTLTSSFCRICKLPLYIPLLRMHLRRLNCVSTASPPKNRLFPSRPGRDGWREGRREEEGGNLLLQEFK